MELGKDVLKMFSFCERCGFCRATCPIQTPLEWLDSASPRGRVLLIVGLLRKELEPSEQVLLRLAECTLCGHCYVTCPQGIKLNEVVPKARALVREAGVALEPYERVVETITEYGNPYGVDRELRHSWTEYYDVEPEGRGEVALWLGCTTAFRRPDTAYAAYRILGEVAGSVAIVEEEECCGAPYYLIGEMGKLREQLERAIEAVEKTGAREVVSTCPACVRSFREYSREVGVEVPFEVYHFAEYLAARGALEKLGAEVEPLRVTYHDPCELGRAMGVFDQPRKVIESVRGAELVEMQANREHSNCCGGGGMYFALEFENSIAIAEKRLREVPSGVEVVVSACPSCEVTLSVAAREGGVDVEVIDLAELLLRGVEK